MIVPGPATRIFLAPGATDLRRSFGKSDGEDSILRVLERLSFYSSLASGRAKQIVPALFYQILWDGCEK